MPKLITYRDVAWEGTVGAMSYVRFNATTGVDEAVSVTVPQPLQINPMRPCFAAYNRRVIITGMWQRNVIFCEDNTLNWLGIDAPYMEGGSGGGSSPFTVTGSGSGTAYIGYLTFVHKIGSTIVAESNPSAGSDSFNHTPPASRSWTNLPTSSINPRVTHIRGYLSVAGGTPKFAWERAIGATSVTETLLDGDLLEDVSELRASPPVANLCEVYHDRMWYGGVQANPERIYFSEIGEAESVDPLNFISTQSNEPVTGLKSVRGELIIFTQNSSYLVTGYDNDDIKMVRLSPTVGCIASHSIVNINEVLFFASTQGIYTYDGAFHYVMDDLADYWRDDYLSNRVIYNDAIGIDDRDNSTYHLLIPKSTSFRYVAYYNKMQSAESQPWYCFFLRNRKDYTVGNMAGIMYTGSVDGYVRSENVEANTSDDGDTANKSVVLRTRLEFGDDVGGEERYGKRWPELEVFLQNEGINWTFEVTAGMEDSITTNFPDYICNVPASNHAGFTAKSHHFFRPEKLSGSGLSLYIQSNFPLNFLFRGFGAGFDAGVQTRPRT